MKKTEYSKLKESIVTTIKNGFTVKAYKIMTENEHNLSYKQYYELTDLIYKSAKKDKLI